MQVVLYNLCGDWIVRSVDLPQQGIILQVKLET